jgi:sulfide:quinone oxidoreductase
MVGGGIFEARHRQDHGQPDPAGVHWIKAAVAAFEPKDNASSSMAAAW